LTSRATIGIGMMLLAVSLATGYTDYHLINWVTFLLGSIMVIVGTGRLFFLDM
jgi:hypothetical protein